MEVPESRSVPGLVAHLWQEYQMQVNTALFSTRCPPKSCSSGVNGSWVFCTLTNDWSPCSSSHNRFRQILWAYPSWNPCFPHCLLIFSNFACYSCSFFMIPSCNDQLPPIFIDGRCVSPRLGSSEGYFLATERGACGIVSCWVPLRERIGIPYRGRPLQVFF